MKSRTPNATNKRVLTPVKMDDDDLLNLEIELGYTNEEADYIFRAVNNFHFAIKFLELEHRKEKKQSFHTADCDLCEFIKSSGVTPIAQPEGCA